MHLGPNIAPEDWGVDIAYTVIGACLHICESIYADENRIDTSRHNLVSCEFQQTFECFFCNPFS